MALMRLVVVVTALLGLAPAARAACPERGWPSTDACKKLDAFFMPGAIGVAYFPRSDAAGTWLGAGVQIAPILWSHNTEKFGPGQGKLVFDIALLDDTEDEAGNLLVYRFGGQLSFERNASRTLFIPFFGVFFGGLHQDAMDDDVGTFEASVGLHALFYKNIVLTLEGGYVFPFSRVDDLAGYKTTLALNFTMW
jgi:hypothetical protein